MIYLFNEGSPGSIESNAGSTDILISWMYILTTGGSPQYSDVAAVALMISGIVTVVSVVSFKKTNVFDMEN